VQGPQVMAGYYRRPDATEETLLTDADGVWLRTGDIVTVDEDAYVTIRDRAKEMIKYKGYQIAPAELEAVLIENPDIADAAVIPKDSGNGMDEIPKAFVVLREGATMSAEEVMAYVDERVAPYKKVREVAFIEAIPKNPSGKILRRELKEKERASS
ncbi:MAG TPA: 4-coumarate--CoA ligase family protein, partial [Acidimicrobiales bacterium]